MSSDRMSTLSFFHPCPRERWLQRQGPGWIMLLMNVPVIECSFLSSVQLAHEGVAIHVSLNAVQPFVFTNRSEE